MFLFWQADDDEFDDVLSNFQEKRGNKKRATSFIEAILIAQVNLMRTRMSILNAIVLRVYTQFYKYKVLSAILISSFFMTNWECTEDNVNVTNTY